MKMNDLRDLSKDDVLSALGLTSKPSTSERLLGDLDHLRRRSAGGGRAALLLAPKSGEALRADLGDRLRNLRPEEAESPEAATSSGEART